MRGPELQGEFINRFDADCSLKAQIPELEDWSGVSLPGVRARNTDDSWVFSADHIECVLRCVLCFKKEAFLHPYPLNSSEDVNNNLQPILSSVMTKAIISTH